MKHGEDIAGLKEAVPSMAQDIKTIADSVTIIKDRLNNMKGFMAGAAAVGGSIAAAVIFLLKAAATFAAGIK